MNLLGCKSAERAYIIVAVITRSHMNNTGYWMSGMIVNFMIHLISNTETTKDEKYPKVKLPIYVISNPEKT